MTDNNHPFEAVLRRIKELYNESINHNWMHVQLTNEFPETEAALAYLKAKKEIVYIRANNGQTIIRPKGNSTTF